MSTTTNTTFAVTIQTTISSLEFQLKRKQAQVKELGAMLTDDANLDPFRINAIVKDLSYINVEIAEISSQLNTWKLVQVQAT